MLLVTAGVIMQADRVLLAQRQGGDLAGRWEFPGGKIEPGEAPEACLIRELREELGITTDIAGYLGATEFAYPRHTVRLLAYHVRWLEGAITLHAHRAVAWVPPDDLRAYDLAPADVPIVALIRRYRATLQP
jgi:8-oxo-dGTP diphosphatase